MVPTFTSLTASTSNADATSYATASITPTANRLLIAIVGCEHASSATTPTLSGGGVSTWTEQASIQGVSTFYRLSAFRALTGASPTSGAITIDFGATTHTGCAWVIVEVADCVLTGTNGSAGIAQSKTNAPGSTAVTATVTFDGAWGADDNRALGGFMLTAGRTLTAGTSFTLLSTVVMTSPSGTVGVEYGRDSDLVVDVSWSSAAQRVGLALEVVGATAGAGPSATTLPQLSTRGLNRWAM